MTPPWAGHWAYKKWQEIFGSPDFAMGFEPGHLAWRTVNLHRRRMSSSGDLLDAGCGEGQDVAFCAAHGYSVTGMDFSENGIGKTQRLLHERGLTATLLLQDLNELDSSGDATLGRQYDVVLFSNVVQDLGPSAVPCLEKLKARVRPQGLIGVSVLAHHDDRRCADPQFPTMSLPELAGYFPDKGWAWIEKIVIEQRSGGLFAVLIASKLGS
jgi:2-polyprenyl-3-methyl-5-hydroxy-6-metoxy-1,4-benzoquinol methylase